MLILVINLFSAMTTFIFGIVGFLVGARVVLKLFGASTASEFVKFAYQTTDSLVAPFAGMFPSPVISGGFILELPAVFAFVVYVFLGIFVVEFLRQITWQLAKREKALLKKEKEENEN